MDTSPNINSTPARCRPLIFIVISLVIIALLTLLAWCWFYKEHPVGTPSGGSGGVAKTGPCTDGAENTLPDGYTFFEDAALGFKFAYPSAWGTVSVTTTPMGGVGGHYLSGSFSAHDDVTFGGNATDYIVSPRGGMPTDNPGYLIANDKFYSVQLWQLNDPSTGTNEAKYDLYPIEEPSELKDACNTKAVVTSVPEYEIVGYAYDVARFNLQPSNDYYGVNLVLKSPTDASRAEFDKIIASFQLIP